MRAFEFTVECLRALPPQAIEDIRFEQIHIRDFAQIQKDALRAVEVDTITGRRSGAR